jgi:hypothetical protein
LGKCDRQPRPGGGACARQPSNIKPIPGNQTLEIKPWKHTHETLEMKPWKPNLEIKT